MAKLTRRAALAALAAIATGGGLLGLGYVLHNIVDTPSNRPNGPRMAGVSGTDMSRYMNLFMRHGELRRRVEDIPGGIRTTTESDSADLVAELQAHVSSMYSHLGQGAEITCMSSSLPTLFRRAPDYQRQITFTAKGVVAEETATDPNLTLAIRAHAREVTGFVVEGMPAMAEHDRQVPGLRAAAPLLGRAVLVGVQRRVRAAEIGLAADEFAHPAPEPLEV